jgi:uncharacterized C2H2 Zn-finger protein
MAVFGGSSRRPIYSGVRPCARGRDGKELIQCPTISCDGMGHVSGNYATHRRQAFTVELRVDPSRTGYAHTDPRK